MKPTLIVLAAGMGSRYGGLKQVDPIGPGGETIIDYSVYDSLRAGFEQFVFIIRKDIEADFTNQFKNRFLKQIDYKLVFQETEMLPDGLASPPERTRPWGTAHALWVTRNVVDDPFVVINADDFYGRDAYEKLLFHLKKHKFHEPDHFAMCGFRLEQTLSEHGSVTRGICKINENGFLESVDEQFHIEKDRQGRIISKKEEKTTELDPGLTVSMNIWAFNPTIFGIIEDKFTMFLRSHLHDLKEEIYIPRLVDQMIREGRGRVKVLHSEGNWFGVTYPEDKKFVKEKLDSLIKSGMYPERLWS